MKFYLIAVACLLGLLTTVSAVAAKPTAEQVSNCRKFLRLPKGEQAVLAKKAGYAPKMARWACDGIIRISKGGHATPPPGYRPPETHEAEPAWYGQSCRTSRSCQANWNCIRGMCKPESYGGCGSGIDSCPAGESCVNGSCR